jgi:hypothetical protein
MNLTVLALSERLPRCQAVHAARELLQSTLENPPARLVSPLVEVPPTPVFSAPGLITEELQRRRASGEDPAAVAIAQGLDKWFSRYREKIAKREVDLAAIVDEFVAQVSAIASTEGIHTAAQLAAREIEGLENIVEKARQAREAEPDASDEQAAGRFLADAEAVDGQWRIGLGAYSPRRARWLRAAAAFCVAFFLVFLLAVAFAPSSPLTVAAGALLVSAPIAYMAAGRSSNDSDPFGFFLLLFEKLRTKLVNHYEDRAARVATLHEGSLAERILTEWRTREWSILMAEAHPAEQLRVLETEFEAYPDGHFVELVPGETVLEGRELLGFVFEHRVSDPRSYFARVTARLAPQTRDLAPGLRSARLIEMLCDTALAEMGGRASLEETLAWMVADVRVRPLLAARIEVSAALARNILLTSGASRFERKQAPGNLAVGVPSLPPGEDFLELLNGAVGQKPSLYLTSNDEALEFFFSALNLPARHSAEHELGRAAAAGASAQDRDGLWRFPRDLWEASDERN